MAQAHIWRICGKKLNIILYEIRSTYVYSVGKTRSHPSVFAIHTPFCTIKNWFLIYWCKISGLFKVNRKFETTQKMTCDFLVINNSNFGRIVHSFWHVQQPLTSHTQTSFNASAHDDACEFMHDLYMVEIYGLRAIFRCSASQYGSIVIHA